MPWRVLAGFLAGVSSVVGMLVLVMLLLLLGGFGWLLRDVAAQPDGEVAFWSALGHALAQSLRAAALRVERALGHACLWTTWRRAGPG